MNQKQKKGFTAMMGALMMLLLTATAAITVSTFTTDLGSDLQMTSGAKELREDLTLENKSLKTDGSLSVTLRNTGSVGVILAAVYFDDERVTLTGPGPILTDGDISKKLSVGDEATFELKVADSLQRGTVHDVKFASSIGGTFTSSVIAR